jgi:hypothetical protein
MRFGRFTAGNVVVEAVDSWMGILKLHASVTLESLDSPVFDLPSLLPNLTCGTRFRSVPLVSANSKPTMKKLWRMKGIYFVVSTLLSGNMRRD